METGRLWEMSEWISVKDRLPIECPPECPGDGGGYSEDVLISDGKVVSCGYTEKGVWHYIGLGERDFPVIFWMPFPEPPKE